MKNLSNILRKSSMTPRERVLVLVHNDIQREETGKSILSESEIFSLTKGWYSRDINAIKEYNKYIDKYNSYIDMRVFAGILHLESELSLQRVQRLLEHILLPENGIKDLLEIDEYSKYISKGNALDYLLENSFLDYEKVIHMQIFESLPKDIQNDFQMLDEYMSTEKEYMEDEIFLYEVYKNGDDIDNVKKNSLVDKICDRMYFEGLANLKNIGEKGGYLFHYFAGLNLEYFLYKYVEKNLLNISKDDNFVDEVLDVIEAESAKKNVSMDNIFKNIIYESIENKLFVNEYIPLFKSNNTLTYSDNTSKPHSELFTIWKEAQDKITENIKSKFVIEEKEIEIFKSRKMKKVITGKSIYYSQTSFSFVNEFKESTDQILPLIQFLLFLKENISITKHLSTLKYLLSISEELSITFEIDLFKSLKSNIQDLEDEINIINSNISKVVDRSLEFISLKNEFKYSLLIDEKAFLFNTKIEIEISQDIIERFETKNNFQ